MGLGSPWLLPTHSGLAAIRKKIICSGLALDHKVTGDRFYTHVTIVGQRLSQKAPSLEEGADVFVSSQDVRSTSDSLPEKSVPFRKSLFSPIFLWSLLTMGMTQLRVIFYMAAMNKMLQYLITGGSEHETSELRQQAAETGRGRRARAWPHPPCRRPAYRGWDFWVWTALVALGTWGL